MSLKLYHLILVTGGTGFLGTHLLRELVKRGESVRAIRRSTSKIFLEEEFSGKVEWMEGDVLDVASMEEAMDGCEKVIHCAAMVSFLPRNRDLIRRVNTAGTANAVNAALEKKVTRFVHVSSVAAIGRNREGIVNENTEWDDHEWNSNYAISKFLAEREVQRGIAEGLNAVIVNPSLIIGSGGNWNDGPPKFFTNVWKGMPYYTENVSGMVSVADVVRAIFLLMESSVIGERFVLDSESWSFNHFFSSIAVLLGKKKPYINVQPWMMQLLWRFEMMKYHLTGADPLITKESARIASHNSRFDNSKMKALGFQFTPIQQCIEETAKKFLVDQAVKK